ncbi:MAG: hypothetical protein E7049_12865 [Lentisphaerae bacterium]|nr:hypothetical protein [Lentisphaerota bacterium]
MKSSAVVVSLMLVCPVVFAEYVRPEVKHFAAWITEVEYDSTNDCYVLRCNPAIKSSVRVYTRGPQYDPLRLRAGETYALACGTRANFTQLAGVGCAVTFTNCVTEFKGVALPAEISGSQRQLLIDGSYSVRRGEIERYAFAVNAEGEAYDAATRTKFHFGFPFRALENKTLNIEPGVERSLTMFYGEAVRAYGKIFDEPDVQAMRVGMNDGVTNSVAVAMEAGGMAPEDVKKFFGEPNADWRMLLCMMEKSKRQDSYVVFCTKENGVGRVVAVVRLYKGKEWHFWSYSRSGTPEFIFLGDGSGKSENYYEYGSGGAFRNYCIASKRGINYHTLAGGVLQKSSDLQKAQAFMSRVEEIFNRYVELDTTGTLKPFVEKLRAQGEEAKAQQEKK